MTEFANNYYSFVSVTTARDLRNTRIGYENLLANGTVTASSTHANFDSDALLNSFTYDLWKPTSLPATLEFDAGQPITADYLGLAAHELENTSVTLAYSSDGFGYSDNVEITLTKNRDLMVLFNEVTARYWRITIDTDLALSVNNPDYSAEFFSVNNNYEANSTDGSVTLGVVYIGKALAMERYIYGGHTPGVFSRTTITQTNKSIEGQFIGRSIIRKGLETQFSFENLTADFYRDEFDLFVKAARTSPFFVLWRPQGYANESIYGWTTNDIAPGNQGRRDFMSVSFSVDAYSGE